MLNFMKEYDNLMGLKYNMYITFTQATLKILLIDHYSDHPKNTPNSFPKIRPISLYGWGIDLEYF